MRSEVEIVSAMNEWLSTEGLDPAEINVIKELKLLAPRGWEIFQHNARFYLEVMPEVMIGAVRKARSQGKCKEWPSA